MHSVPHPTSPPAQISMDLVLTPSFHQINSNAKSAELLVNHSVLYVCFNSPHIVNYVCLEFHYSPQFASTQPIPVFSITEPPIRGTLLATGIHVT